MAAMNKGFPRLEVTVTDSLIFAQYFKTRSADPEKASARFEPSDWSKEIIDFLIEQLKFMVGDNVFTPVVEKNASIILSRLIRLLGEHLYNVLFRAEALKDNQPLEQILNTAMENEKLLRIELEFDGKSEVYADWPWEYLYKPEKDTGKFLAAATRLVLIRKLSILKAITGVKTHRPKVLLIISAPNKLPVNCSALTEELKRLDGEYIELRIMQNKELQISPSGDLISPEANWEVLRKTLSHEAFDIIHFVGHGKCTAEGAEIALVAPGGEDEWKSDQQFAEMASLNPTKPKLVFLQACESALPNTYKGVSGVARALASKNIPAVVAMQYKIRDDMASWFAIAFYKALADGKSIDLAVQDGREAILSHDLQLQNHAFGLPVLYLRSYDSICEKEENKQSKPLPGAFNTSPPQATTESLCPKCQVPFSPEEQVNFCVKCGFDIKSYCVTHCPYCGIERKSSYIFCKGCGKKLPTLLYVGSAKASGGGTSVMLPSEQVLKDKTPAATGLTVSPPPHHVLGFEPSGSNGSDK